MYAVVNSDKYQNYTQHESLNSEWQSKHSEVKAILLEREAELTTLKVEADQLKQQCSELQDRLADSDQAHIAKDRLRAVLEQKNERLQA